MKIITAFLLIFTFTPMVFGQNLKEIINVVESRPGTYITPDAVKYYYGEVNKVEEKTYKELLAKSESRLYNTESWINAVLTLGDMGPNAIEAISVLVEQFPSVMHIKISEETYNSTYDGDFSRWVNSGKVAAYPSMQMNNPIFNLNSLKEGRTWYEYEGFIKIDSEYKTTYVRYNNSGGVERAEGNRIDSFFFYPGAYALTKITGQKLGIDQEKWKKWWDENKIKYETK